MTTGICADDVQPISANSTTEAISQPESRGTIIFRILYLLIIEREVSLFPIAEERKGL